MTVKQARREAGLIAVKLDKLLIEFCKVLQRIQEIEVFLEEKS